MGSRAHIIVVGGDEALLDQAVDRVEELESRWSRFRSDSEISELNRRAGEFCSVSTDTSLMVERAIELWRMTGASVDPLVLGAVVEAGYDRSFETLAELHSRASSNVLPEPWTMIACTDIEVDRDSADRDSADRNSVIGQLSAGPDRIRLPHGSRFDPGGIGKGLAADLIVSELLMAGAAGACVNLGGDLRVDGAAPQEGGWTIAIEHPITATPLFQIRIADGAIATSTILRRIWTMNGEHRHHLIDPMTGQPSATDLVQASVVCGQAWVAEGLAKAILLHGSDHPFDLLPDGIEAVAIHRNGQVIASDGMHRFADAHTIPAHVDLDHEAMS